MLIALRTVVIPNGYLGAALGTTLTDLLALGAAGDVSFDLVSNTNVASGQYAYWNVELTNPSNTSQQIQINAFGDNNLGPNPFNQGSSTNASCWQGAVQGCSFATWGSGGTAAFLPWLVDSLTISVGGWQNVSETNTIDPITLPGTRVVSAVPLPAALPLFAGGLGMMGLLARRKRRMAPVCGDSLA